MKKIIVLAIIILANLNGYSKEKIGFSDPTEKTVITKNVTPLNADPCLDAALNAQSNTFNAESLGHGLCSASVNNGSLAISEYGGCCFAFTLVRQLSIAYIQSTFVPCPSGNGAGII